VLGGSLGDLYGRRRMVAVGPVGFGLSSAPCEAAPSVEAFASCEEVP
jgi:MFS family permease